MIIFINIYLEQRVKNKEQGAKNAESGIMSRTVNCYLAALLHSLKSTQKYKIIQGFKFNA